MILLVTSLGNRFDCGSKFGYLKANIALGLANDELSVRLKKYIEEIKDLQISQKITFLLPPEQSQNIPLFFCIFSGLYKSKQTHLFVKGLRLKTDWVWLLDWIKTQD